MTKRRQKPQSVVQELYAKVHKAALRIACRRNSCRAEPGEECRTALGRPRHEVHQQRSDDTFSSGAVTIRETPGPGEASDA